MLVAVVGAGAGGLASIKNCLEGGHDVIAFEKEASGEPSTLTALERESIFLNLRTSLLSSVGGLWRYKENDNSVTTVMESTVANYSKHRVRKILPLRA